LFREVVNIHNNFSETCCFQFQDNMLQQWLPGNGEQSFRDRIGKRFETCAQTGSKN